MKIVDEDLITTDFIPFLSENGIAVYALRLDKIHPIISGNKWFKLRYYLQEAIQKNKSTIATFGGAYSNHIVATAAASKLLGLKSIGIIRGEEPKQYSPTLIDAGNYGMQFKFLSREAYQSKQLPQDIFSDEYYLIPEGGYGLTGALGAATIPYLKEKFQVICCATGTGTMLAGLINEKTENSTIVGFSVLKNNFSVIEEVKSLLVDKVQPVNINFDFHFGGYAKHTPALIDFMNSFYQKTTVPTDFVYTAKLFYAVKELISEKYFPPNINLLVIHSGGLQGNKSLRKGTLIF